MEPQLEPQLWGVGSGKGQPAPSALGWWRAHGSGWLQMVQKVLTAVVGQHGRHAAARAPSGA